MATDEKSNEITAVPELLELLDIEGTIITADAMSCQKKIVRKIIRKGADYVINLKGNQYGAFDVRGRNRRSLSRALVMKIRSEELASG